MTNFRFYAAGESAALQYAVENLTRHGYTFLPCPDDTATHLILPVPSFDDQGYIIGGEDLSEVLRQLPETVTVVGGHLDHPLLRNYKTVDLLKDHQYLTRNAKITACCAVGIAMEQLDGVLADYPCLVIGWGRIGKSLVRFLRGLDVKVTVCARKEGDRAILRALGYESTDISHVDPRNYRIIFNTAPQMVLPDSPAGILKIDLASVPGLGGRDVIRARQLPGLRAPYSSGKLIAQTVMEKESLL